MPAREELGDAGQQGVDAAAARRRTEVHRVDPTVPCLGGELLAQASIRQRRLITDVRTEDGLVVLCEGLGQRRPVGLVGRYEALEGRVAGPGAADRAHRHHGGRQPPGHRRDDPLRVGPGPVDLVDEEQRRDVEPLEGPEEERRLGLDTLDRRDDEDGAVEDAEDAFDLGDEVGVAGGVDEVDREIAHEERGDRGSDRDAALALELERVGLGGAGVDAAEVVDRAGDEEESLAEGGLTGVDVGEDSEIERTHGASSLPRRWSPSGWT